MKTIKYYIRLYGLFIKQFIKVRLQFRVDFILNVVGMFIINFVGVVTFKSIYDHVDFIGGWNYYELLFVYGLSLIVMSPQQFLFDNLWYLTRRISSGEFIKYMMRPISIFVYYTSETIDLNGIGQCLFGIVTIIYAGTHLHIVLSFGKVAIFCIFILSSVLLNMGLIMAGSLISFLGGKSTTFLSIVVNFRDYGKYPVTIFNSFFKIVFTFIIPIFFISFYPSQFLLRTSEVGVVNYLLPLISLIVFFGSYFLWKKCAENYVGTGS